MNSRRNQGRGVPTSSSTPRIEADEGPGNPRTTPVTTAAGMGSAGGDTLPETEPLPTQPTQITQLDCGGNEDLAPAAPSEWGTLIRLSDNTVFQLRESEFWIGRKSTCDLVLVEQRVSEKHCLLSPNGGGQRRQKQGTPKRGGGEGYAAEAAAVLLDNSTNGTYVNGSCNRLERGRCVLLRSGDTFSLLHPQMKAGPAPVEFSFQFFAVQQSRTGFFASYNLTGRSLGSGTSSTVKECIHRQTGERFAVKIVPKKRFLCNAKALAGVKCEVAILSKLKHTNVVRYVGIFEDDATLYIVLELVPRGDLLDRILRDGIIVEDKARAMFKQILAGVKYLHEMDVTHRDLKPDNILLAGTDENPVPKITDFGVAHNSRMSIDKDLMTTVCGTPQYAAPEILTRGKGLYTPGDCLSVVTSYGKEVDMWSLGVILYMMLSGSPPFVFDDPAKPSMYDQITRCLYDFPVETWGSISPAAIDLIKKLLLADPSARLTAMAALAHPWMAEESVAASPTSGIAGQVVSSTATPVSGAPLTTVLLASKRGSQGRKGTPQRPGMTPDRKQTMVRMAGLSPVGEPSNARVLLDHLNAAAGVDSSPLPVFRLPVDSESPTSAAVARAGTTAAGRSVAVMTKSASSPSDLPTILAPDSDDEEGKGDPSSSFAWRKRDSPIGNKRPCPLSPSADLVSRRARCGAPPDYSD